VPTENTLDRGTTTLPRLLYERLDEFGTDFAIIYPTAGLRVPRIGDDGSPAVPPARTVDGMNILFIRSFAVIPPDPPKHCRAPSNQGSVTADPGGEASAQTKSSWPFSFRRC